MASINSPQITNAIRTDVPAINAILKALAKADPSLLSDIENGTKRFYEGTSGWEFQELIGGTWTTHTKFNIDAQSVDGYNSSIDAVANTIVVRDANGKLKGNLTGKADTAGTADNLASTLAVNAGGTGATKAEDARTNLGVPPTNHASTTTTYGVSSATQYGHPMASSTTPKADGTAAVGSETSKFARGDHVHPQLVASASVRGDVILSDSASASQTAATGHALSPKGGQAVLNAAFAIRGTNPITSTANDTTAKWAAITPGVYWYNAAGYLVDQPAQYGFLVHYVNSSDVFQIWNTQSGGPMYTRSGNASGWNGTWKKHQYTAGTGISISSANAIALATVVTAGNAGPTANASPGYGGNFTVPYITYDAYGRVTGRTNRTITFPAAGGGAKAYVTATYVSGTSWYRKYSDGWIEQGGAIPATSSYATPTITLITAFTNTNYFVVVGNGMTSNSNVDRGAFVYAKTTSNFAIRNALSYDGWGRWYACGN